MERHWSSRRHAAAPGAPAERLLYWGRWGRRLSACCTGGRMSG
jgi:hypothetical protein